MTIIRDVNATLDAETTKVIGTVNISAGQAVTVTGVATATNQTAAATLTGAVNETAPATDTASSGLNGRLQRIAQRITSLITALGSPFQAGGSIGNTAFGINGVAISPLAISGTANAAGTDLVASMDVSSYRSISLQTTGTWAGTVAIQFSNTNVSADFISASLRAITAASGGGTTITTNTINVASVSGKYMRIRLLTLTSGGPVTGTGFLFPDILPAGTSTLTLSGLSTEATLSALSAKIPTNGVLSTNSSTVALNTLATFTGTAVDVSLYSQVTLAVITDQIGTMYADWSTDGTNWDYTVPYVLVAGTATNVVVDVKYKWFRVRMYNSSVTNQTYLRLQCMARQ